LLTQAYQEPENFGVKVQVKDLTLMGEKAEADVVYSYDYDMRKDSHEDMVKATWHIDQEVTCTDSLRRKPEIGTLEIEHSNCTSKFKISELNIIEKPDYMQNFNIEEHATFLSTIKF
jgi:hypothetical protein